MEEEYRFYAVKERPPEDVDWIHSELEESKLL